MHTFSCVNCVDPCDIICNVYYDKLYILYAECIIYCIGVVLDMLILH